MANTGYQAYTTLEQYYVATGLPTGTTKPNTIGDPDYVAPVLDLVDCPLPTTTTTSTTSTTTTAPTTTSTTSTTTTAPTTTTSTTTSTTTIPPTTTSTTTSTTTAVPYSSYSVRLNPISGYPAICTVSPQTVYTAFGQSISPGYEVFTDPTLLNPATGYDFIVEEAGGGQIYTIGSGTAVIGTATGFC